MLDLEPMRKVRVLTPKSDVERVIQALYDFGDIEVRECRVSELDKPLSSFEPVSEMLLQLRAVEHELGLRGSVTAPEITLAEGRKAFQALGLADLKKLQERLSHVQSKRDDLLSRRKELLPFRKLALSPEELESASLKFIYFSLKPNAELPLKAALKRFSHQLLFVRDEKATHALLAFDARQEAEISLVVLPCAALVHAFPPSEKRFADEFRGVDSELAVAEAELERLRRKVGEYAQHHAQKILSVRASLELLAQKAELPFKFGKTAHFSVVEGWIQEKEQNAFETRLRRLPHVLVEYPVTQETGPSKLYNTELVRPFEFLVEFFSLPKTRSLDPTLFVSLTFPLFFGMILGDVGYGVLALLLALFLKLKTKSLMVNRLAGMLALCAFSTIVFGFVYGEVFGLEHFLGFEFTPLIHRLGEPQEIINLSIAVGAAHVGLGLLLGFVAQARGGHWKHAFAKLSWLAIELSMIALVLQFSEISLLEMLEPVKHWIPMPFSAALLASGLLGVGKLESPTALVELPGLISNVLSYLRLAALGISAAVLALIINEQIVVDVGGFVAMVTLQQPFDVLRFLGFLGLSLMLVLGNAAALVLGLIESSIQTLRLHYVEFFSKFYEGGGVPFKPLRSKEAG